MTNWGYNYYQYFYNALGAQQKKLNQLEKTIKILEKEIDTLKKQPPNNIEKIEYKFDQLKVETLSGTLNVGINPYGQGEPIEDFSVNQQPAKVTPAIVKKYPHLFTDIQSEIDNYMNQNGQGIIQSYEQKYNRKLEGSHYQYMVDDVKKQLDERIMYYLSQVDESQITQQQVPKIQSSIVHKVKNDIDLAFDSFMKQMPKEGME